MDEIRQVAILGAGAMGAYFATRFYETQGFSTTLIASADRYERLCADGLLVNGIAYHIPVVQPQEATAPADLLIVALKHHHLAETLPTLQKLIGAQTTILSVMNGLESEELIGAQYGMDKLLYTISVGIDAVRTGNQITYTKGGKHYFGELNNSVISARVQRVQRALARAAIVYETPVDMLRILWWKFMINVGMNQASAVMRAPYGVFHTDADAQALMEALMLEVIALAQVLGVNLSRQDISDWYTFLRTLSAEGKTSMLQDVEAGRKTEVEVFAGTVTALGKQHGVATPANESMLHILRVLEKYPSPCGS